MLGFIAKLFPRARVIHCIRDPIDTCWSCFSRSFNNAQGWSTKLDALARIYRQHEQAMAHWKEHLPLPILELRYEDLISDFEPLSKRLIDFCGLEWNDACLDQQHAGPTSLAVLL